MRKPRSDKRKDWSCEGCGNFNYGFRDQCNKCQAVRTDGAAAASDPSAKPAPDPSAKPAPARPRKSTKSPRQRVKMLTQQIVQFAKRRRLADAQQVFKKMLAEGLSPGLLTYSTFINAHVASGDIAGAESVFQQMRSAGLAPNSVIYNTLFKGYCTAGDTQRTAALLEEMATKEINPDTNTVNAHLQGCLRAGDVQDASDVFSRMNAQWSATPDFFSYKRVGQILSRGLRLDAVKAIIRDLKTDTSGSPAVAAAIVWLHLHRGLAAALLGQWTTASSSLKKVDAAGAGTAVAPEVHLSRSIDKSAAQSEARGQHDFHLKVFQGEVERLRSFLEQVGEAAEAPDLVDAFCRTFIVGQHLANQQSEHGEQVAEGLVRGVVRSFGLDVVLSREDLTLESIERKVKRRLRKGRLCWDRIFKTKRARDDAEHERLPFKLEICSGFGEWVVAQAKAEAGLAHWGGLELRYDRVHSIFSRMVFEDVRNLCVLGGDASQVLPEYINPESVDHIFINFPEPPQTNMAEGAESRWHLLTAEFFMMMHTVLVSDGKVTILHDEFKYVCLLARTIAELRDGSGQTIFESVQGLKGKGKTKEDYEEVEGVRVYSGTPGKRSGHVVDSVSYFDQLWETKQRYFLVIRKC